MRRQSWDLALDTSSGANGQQTDDRLEMNWNGVLIESEIGLGTWDRGSNRNGRSEDGEAVVGDRYYWKRVQKVKKCCGRGVYQPTFF